MTIAAIADPDLLAPLQPELLRLGLRGPFQLRRTLIEHYGSYHNEKLEVEDLSGAPLQLFFKNYGTSVLLKDGSELRRERERWTYRNLLADRELGTARCVAEVWETGGRHWLFLEFVRGELLRYSEFAAWIESARWLARMHAAFLKDCEWLSTEPLLLRHDAEWFAAKAGRAEHAIAEAFPAYAERLARVLEVHQRCVPLSTRAPRTLVHGSFRPKNILIAGDGPAPRVCAVDWELASFGSTMYDLAFLCEGFHGEAFEQLWRAYDSEAQRLDVPRLDKGHAFLQIEIAQLQKIVKALSEAQDWRFEEESVNRYLLLAERLAARMETELRTEAVLRPAAEGSAPGQAQSRDALQKLWSKDECLDTRPLVAVLDELLGSSWTIDAQERLLRARVRRIRFRTGTALRSLVIKKVRTDRSLRERMVAGKWLPAIGLQDRGPPLLDVAAETHGRCVWHVYEDLGDCMLRAEHPDPEHLESAVQLIADLHTRAADHPLLGEVRLHGGEHGLALLAGSIEDCVRALGALHRRGMGGESGALLERWLERLAALQHEMPARRALFQSVELPDTLLHGDLWPKNALVVPVGGVPTARLIDWDHAGIGPVSFDLSTFLSRFPAALRRGVLDRYRAAVAGAGWKIPDETVLDELFDAAELTRLVHCLVWPAMGASTDESLLDWAFGEIAELEEWLLNRESVFGTGGLNQGHVREIVR